MITLEEYFGVKEHTPIQKVNAADLLRRVNALLDELGFDRLIDPDTGSEISGVKGGAGDGGFRLPTSKTGATFSAHKEARAVDVYDPVNAIDNAISEDESILERHGLWREVARATNGWCHLTTRAPYGKLAAGSRSIPV